MHNRASRWDGVTPGPVRSPKVEARARFIASMALSASHGYPPQPRCAPYISPSLFKHLVTRARAHAIRSSRPSWRGRTYLCRINRDVIEATVVANDGKATHAVAMRLEHVGGLWRASDLVII